MILLDGVTKKYPGDEKPALDGVSLHIEPNEFVFLVGKSGAGKSTLMKMITKEENPDAGKIIIGGIDLDYVKKRHIPGYRRRLGVVFQDFKLLPRRTVYENVAFALEIAGMSGKDIRKTVPKVLELVDLLDQAKKFPDQLSGGQQQRVSIARSVARQPKILIADEPTANLDKLTTEEIIGLLKRINDFGTTILVTTHNENIVNTLQKRVVTLKDGKIVNDQKNHGIYKLDETPVPKTPVRTVESVRIDINSVLTVFRPSDSDQVALAEVAELKHFDFAFLKDRHAVHSALFCKQPFPVHLEVFRENAHRVEVLRCYSIKRRRFENSFRCCCESLLCKVRMCVLSQSDHSSLPVINLSGKNGSLAAPVFVTLPCPSYL